jgi:hypothetical protein
MPVTGSIYFYFHSRTGRQVVEITAPAPDTVDSPESPFHSYP